MNIYLDYKEKDISLHINNVCVTVSNEEYDELLEVLGEEFIHKQENLEFADKLRQRRYEKAKEFFEEVRNLYYDKDDNFYILKEEFIHKKPDGILDIIDKYEKEIFI